MKRFARALAATFGIVVLSSFVLLVPQKRASAQNAGPTVTIGSPIPLPVKQSGNWNVGLAPNATVGISGTPNVSVGNFPSTLTGTSVPVSVKQSANFKTVAFSVSNSNYNEVLPDGTLSTTLLRSLRARSL